MNKREKIRLVPDNDTLRKLYPNLGPTDAFAGALRLKQTEEYLLLDLQSRGVRLFPAALAQLISRSKAMQAAVYSRFMLPGTRVIHDLHDLLSAMNHYQRLSHDQVVTKQDRANGGIGINLWSSLEGLYNQASLAGMPFPFVLQPFLPDCRDIRVIIIGDYQEAYSRENPHNFRNNLHCGGSSRPVKLSRKQLDICRQVMTRGDFPYGHLDLMTAEDGQTYLAEINLRGGLRGARITAQDYHRRIEQSHRAWTAETVGGDND